MERLYRKLENWPAIFAVLIGMGAFAGIAVGFLNPAYLWIVASATAFLLLIWVLLWYFLLRKDLLKELVLQGLEHDELLAGQMEGLALPYAVLSENDRILWHNEAFRDIVARFGLPEADPYGSIRDIFPELKESGFVNLGSQTFRAEVRPLQDGSGNRTLLLVNETEHLNTARRLEEEQNNIGIIYVDNFEDLMRNTEEADQGLLEAVIGQKIHKYFEGFGGVVVKTERDRFFVTIDARGLGCCRRDRFGLLEQVKTIREGNSRAVTVTVAFGAGEESFVKKSEQAHAAMDLALGRGGDQAVIKTGDEFEYFGGKAQGDAADTRVKARLKAQALREVILPRSRVFIMGHRLADNDSFGAAVAVYRAAVSLHKTAHIVLDSVSFSVRPFWERFETSADYPREMFITGDTAAGYITENDLVVVVDTNRAAMCECPALLEKTPHVVVIDHHRQMEDAIPSVLSYVEPYASSACEMTAEVLQYFGDDLRPRAIEAEAVYSGIVVDTNGFTDRTGARTFEAAAYLKRSGANLVLVKKLLRENVNEYRAKAETIHRAEMFMDRYAFAVCKAEGLDSPTVVGAQAANELLNIAGVQASFVFTLVGTTVFVSLRSIDEINVQLIAERLGGGGHLSVAGVQLKNMTVEEAQRLLRDTIQKMTEEGSLS